MPIVILRMMTGQGKKPFYAGMGICAACLVLSATVGVWLVEQRTPGQSSVGLDLAIRLFALMLWLSPLVPYFILAASAVRRKKTRAEGA